MNKLYYARAVAAIMTAGAYPDFKRMMLAVASFWQAWTLHPSYKDPEDPQLIFDVPAAGVWEHEPGRGGHTESYVISFLPSVISSISWGQRTYGGEFLGLFPIWLDAPFSFERICTISFSYKGAGGAAEARARLRKMMPKIVRPYIRQARSVNWRTKALLVKGRDLTAEELKRTKGEIFMQDMIPAIVLLEINKFMTPADFWRCATGRVHPNNVSDLLHPSHGKQLTLFNSLD